LNKTESAKDIVDNIQEIRNITRKIKYLENELNQINIFLAKDIAKLSKISDQFPQKTGQMFVEIAKIANMTEQKHRLAQVRNRIFSEILALLAES
jgi:Ni,Fe-hydrogenase I large subunit